MGVRLPFPVAPQVQRTADKMDTLRAIRELALMALRNPGVDLNGTLSEIQRMAKSGRRR